MENMMSIIRNFFFTSLRYLNKFISSKLTTDENSNKFIQNLLTAKILIDIQWIGIILGDLNFQFLVIGIMDT